MKGKGRKDGRGSLMYFEAEMSSKLNILNIIIIVLKCLNELQTQHNHNNKY